MSNSRREFLQSSAALAAGLMSGAAARLDGQAVSQLQPQRMLARLGQVPPAASIQIPKMKFGNAEIGRLVLGANPLYGFAHFNRDYGNTMANWYTQDKVCEVMHRANSFGINAFNYVNMGRAPQDLARFQAEGGRMHLIVQVTARDDEVALVRNLKPLALQRRGEEVDLAFRNGTMAGEREWCKRVRDLGVMVGVGTHKPEVIEFVEEQGWDVDFYSGCVYNRTRTESEWREILGGELPEMPSDVYIQSDPARMYKVIRQTAKTCFAFKILAAGRVGDEGVLQALRTAFENIKSSDGIYLGMFPSRKDEVEEDARIVHDILTHG
ncbi:MAG TPA: hypothetical protein VMU48_16550 [Terracidiphilus sp.]|nr:hypothetical protein [Terracidiphilus sp.]